MNCIENCIKFLWEQGYEPSLRKGCNGTYCCIDIPRHEDDFWKSSEYKECENILGDLLLEGYYGSDIYTLFVRNNEDIDKAAEKYEKERPYNDYVCESIKAAFKAGAAWKEKQMKQEKAYDAFFEQSVWAYCRDVERVIRPFSTSDFESDYFIPDL